MKLSAPRVSLAASVGEDHEVPVVGVDDRDKSAARPEVVLMISSREPVESLTTDAVTPRL